MNLYRFTAFDSERALLKVYESLGQHALIYATKKIPGGVEILAANPQENAEANKSDAVGIHQESYDRLIDKLNIKLQMIDEDIQKLSTCINSLYAVVDKSRNRKKIIPKWLKTLNPFRKYHIKFILEGHSHDS